MGTTDRTLNLSRYSLGACQLSGLFASTQGYGDGAEQVKCRAAALRNLLQRRPLSSKHVKQRIRNPGGPSYQYRGAGSAFTTRIRITGGTRILGCISKSSLSSTAWQLGQQHSDHRMILGDHPRAIGPVWQALPDKRLPPRSDGPPCGPCVPCTCFISSRLKPRLLHDANHHHR